MNRISDEFDITSHSPRRRSLRLVTVYNLWAVRLPLQALQLGPASQRQLIFRKEQLTLTTAGFRRNCCSTR